MGRAHLGAVIAAAVLWSHPARAGDSRAVPPVRVVAPSAANGIKLERDDLPVPMLEVTRQRGKIDLPAVPSFELPSVEAGVHTPRALRIRGGRISGEIKVRGYVTWVYDCAQTLATANPDASASQIGAAVRSDPSLCERPMFALGDARDTPRDASILVVEIRTMPRIAVGDPVLVTGVWGNEARDEMLDGVLAFRAVEPSASPEVASDAPPLKELEIDLDVDAPPALRRFVDDVTLNASIDHLNLCNKAIAVRQYDAAIAECQRATEVWQDNHLAWYAWASVHMARREWPEARALIENAVTLRPDLAMYQMYLGIALYEIERQRARDDQARATGKRPDEVVLDPAALQLDPARDALNAALKSAPDLWRAHYYLGRIYRDLDDPRRAAQQFTATVKTHPGYRFAYIALSELYRRWDHADEALAVAAAGAARVPAAEAAELWFEVGMAYDAKRLDDKAIEAFGRAIAARPDDALSKLQRGQLQLRKGDLPAARRDLEDAMKSADPRIAPARALVTRLLGQIARSKDTPRSRGPAWDCRRTGSAIVCRPLFTPGTQWVRGFRESRPE